MSKICMVTFFFLLFSSTWCQNIGLGTSAPDASAILDISNTGKGLLIPRMSSSNIQTIVNPAKGLLVYDSLKNQLVVNMGTPAKPDWESISARSAWSTTGNAKTDSATNFIGTTDGQPLLFRVNNQPAGMIDSFSHSSYLGYGAGRNNTGGAAFANTAFGYKSMEQNTTGTFNTAFGVQTLSFNNLSTEIGNFNTAVGYQAIKNCQGNFGNTGIGYQALFNCTTDLNTAVGYQALFSGGGGSNTATGAQALYYGGGVNNTAIGAKALYNSSSSASYNTANGYESMLSNYSGSANTASGYLSMHSNYSGQYNTAFGSSALYANTYGSQNTTVGYNSLINTTGSDGNTAIGYNAGSGHDNGYYNCFIGSETDANDAGYYNTIALGHGTLVTAPSMMRVGNDATISIGAPVGWSTVSDGRVKKNIQENVPGLSFISKLRPVSYNVDLSAVDRITRPETQNRQNEVTKKIVSNEMAAAYKAKEEIVYTGFIAQEVEQTAQSIHYNFSGVDAARNAKDLYGLRYADFVVPLVKAVQELSAQNNQIEKDNDLLAKENELVLRRIAALKGKLH